VRQEETHSAVDRQMEVAVDRHQEEDHPQGEDFQQDTQPVVVAAVMEN